MPWSRRNFLTTSTAGLLSVGARAATPTASTAPKYLITVLAEGGWDPTMTIDPKIGVPTIDGPEVDATGILNGADRFQQQAFDVIVGGVSEAFDLSKSDSVLVTR